MAQQHSTNSGLAVVLRYDDSQPIEALDLGDGVLLVKNAQVPVGPGPQFLTLDLVRDGDAREAARFYMRLIADKDPTMAAAVQLALDRTSESFLQTMEKSDA